MQIELLDIFVELRELQQRRQYLLERRSIVDKLSCYRGGLFTEEILGV